MCGFAGFVHQPAPAAELEARARAMADAIATRGPDDSGTWADPEAGYAVGHRRLAILDLSPLGHQPMVAGDLVLAYNGEIYN
ncbi:MAG: asparagine synthetase B, partial [Pseudomonadota bacterium]